MTASEEAIIAALGLLSMETLQARRARARQRVRNARLAQRRLEAAIANKIGRKVS